MNSKNLKGLCEAYGGIYTPQELTEEQVWEEVETWVNSLLEEGYDLSDYTWEEMYEAYLNEASQGDIGARVGRGLMGALRDLPSGLQGQLAGKDNAALQRQRQRAQNLRTLLTTGKVPTQSTPTAKPQPQQPLVDKSGNNVFDGTSTTAVQQKPAAPLTKPSAPVLPAASSTRSTPTSTPPRTPAASRPRPVATPAAQPKKPTTPTGPAVGKLGSTSFERRTPTSAELKAAQAARAGGASPEKALQAAQKTNLPTTGPSPAIPNSASVSSSMASVKPRDMTKNPLKPTSPTTMKNSYEWGSTSKLVDDIANLYQSVYEAKKIDQDNDGDTDFADVRIARLIASGMSREEAIRRVKDKSYNEEVEIDEATATPPSKFNIRRGLDAKSRRLRRSSDFYAYGQDPDPEERKISTSKGEGGITKNPKKLRKQKAMGEIDEATRMRRELGKEGEIATRKELASRSKAYQRSGSVDRTIATAEREADRTTARNRDETSDDYKNRMQNRSKTLRGLAANRRKSVRSGEGLRGYAAKVEGGDKDLQSARGSARSAGTLTPAEKKGLGEEFDLWVNALIYEGYDLSEYTWDEMIEIYEETEEERKRNERRARVAELHASGRVMTSSKRASQKATQRKQDKQEEMANRLLRSIQASGSTRSSSTPMGTTEPEEKPEVPTANRKLGGKVKKDDLASQANAILRTIKNENIQLWVNDLITEGYDLTGWTSKEITKLYFEIFE